MFSKLMLGVKNTYISVCKRFIKNIDEFVQTTDTWIGRFIYKHCVHCHHIWTNETFHISQHLFKGNATNFHQ